MILYFLLIFTLFFSAVLVATRARKDPSVLFLERFTTLQAAAAGAAAGNDDLLKRTADASGFLLALLARHGFHHWLAQLSLQAARPVPPAAFLRKSSLWAVAGFAAGYLLLHHLLAAVPSACVLAYGPTVILKLQRRRRLTALDNSLPEVIEMMSRALRAGHALVAAIGIVADQAPQPARGEFAEVFRQQNFGLPLRDALLQMLDRVPSQDLRVLVTAILVQKDTGGNLTQILDRTASVIRERLKLKGDIRVHTAQGRLTGWILCMLPIVMLVLINLINPGYSDALTGTPTGQKLLYVGAGLLAAGAFLIRRIVNGIEI